MTRPLRINVSGNAQAQIEQAAAWWAKNRPAAPGAIREELDRILELLVTAAAKALGISRKTLSAVLNGRAGISPEMAVRLSLAFGTSAYCVCVPRQGAEALRRFGVEPKQ